MVLTAIAAIVGIIISIGTTAYSLSNQPSAEGSFWDWDESTQFDFIDRAMHYAFNAGPELLNPKDNFVPIMNGVLQVKPGAKKNYHEKVINSYYELMNGDGAVDWDPKYRTRIKNQIREYQTKTGLYWDDGVFNAKRYKDLAFKKGLNIVLIVVVVLVGLTLLIYAKKPTKSKSEKNTDAILELAKAMQKK